MPHADELQIPHYDLAVIGAGVGGAMTALLSARAGLRTLLVERQSFPRTKVCGCCLNGRAVQILTQAGLGPGLRNLQPTTTSSLAIRLRGKKLDIPFPSGIAVSRSAMDQWLVNEAIAAGSRFLDHTTASVEPFLDEGPERRSEGFQSSVAEIRPQRLLELRCSGSATDEESIAQNSHQSAHVPQRISAKVVVVSDGLGHPSLHCLPEFRSVARQDSRIGLGAVFERTFADEWINRGEILMAVAPHGYAGVVEIENGQLNLAAAVDPHHLHETKSPFETLRHVFCSAGVPLPGGLQHVGVKGTLPLTRASRQIAGHRLFLLGDSAGYVEPFTGEGMAWALSAATAVVPLVVNAVQNGWSDSLKMNWRTAYRGIVGREQRICRILSAALRRPWLLPPILATCRYFPSITQRIVRQINRTPEAVEHYQ